MRGEGLGGGGQGGLLGLLDVDRLAVDHVGLVGGLLVGVLLIIDFSVWCISPLVVLTAIVIAIIVLDSPSFTILPLPIEFLLERIHAFLIANHHHHLIQILHHIIHPTNPHLGFREAPQKVPETLLQS